MRSAHPPGKATLYRQFIHASKGPPSLHSLPALLAHGREERLEIEVIASLDAPAAEALGAVLGRNARPAIDAPAFRKRAQQSPARITKHGAGSSSVPTAG